MWLVEKYDNFTFNWIYIFFMEKELFWSEMNTLNLKIEKLSFRKLEAFVS